MRTRTAVAAALALGLVLASSAFGMAANADPTIAIDSPLDGSTTSDQYPVFSGSAPASAAVTVFGQGGAGTLCTASADPSTGAWSCSPASPLDYGAWTVFAEIPGAVEGFVDSTSVTFTIEAPPLPDPVVTLNPATYYDIDTELGFTGTTNRDDISGIAITFQDGSTASCTISASDDPTLWACDASIDTGLPVGDATLDFSFAGGGLAQQGFTVSQAVTFNSPGPFHTTDSNLEFTGNFDPAATIASATITFSDHSTADCGVSWEGSSWSCSYDSTLGSPSGPGHLDVTLVESSKSYPRPFTVLDFSAHPSLDPLNFDGTPGTIAATGRLTGGASSGTVAVYAWDSGGPTLGSSCPILGDACDLGVSPGLGEVRATQQWEDEVEPTTTSYTFRIPEAPWADANPQPDGTVVFTGYGTPTDLILVTDADGTPLCQATVFGDGQWDCQTEGPLASSDRHFFVRAEDTGSGEADSATYLTDHFPEGFVATYQPGGLSPYTEISIPDVAYLFTPSNLTVTVNPTTPGTVAGVQAYVIESPNNPPGCPNYALFEGGGDFPGINPGELVCSFTDLEPGPWIVEAYQDKGDGQTMADTSLYRDFFIPEAPVINTVSGNIANALIIAGNVGDSDYHAVSGDVVHVVVGATELCAATVKDDGSWACTSGVMAGGIAYSPHAYVEDRGEGGCGCDAGYLPGGKSALSTPDFSVTLPTLSTGGGDTLPATGTTVTPPALIWTFDVKGLDLNHVHPGDKFTITGVGLPPGSVITIELHSTPVTLGTVTVAPDGTFSLSGTIPANVDPGAHHIVATLSGPGLTPTAVDKAITIEGESTPTTSTDTTTGATSDSGSSEHNADALHDPGTAPNILTDSLNPIAEVFTDPGRVPAAFAAGLVLLLFAIMPAHLLNATLGEQYERFARRVPRLRNQPRWFAGLKAALDRAPLLGGVIITAITGFLFAFADPTFGFNLHSLRLVLALGAALFAVTYLANAITALIMRKAWDVDVVVSIRPLGLVLTVVGVIASRIMDFSPGFLIGLVLGLSIASHSAAKQAWKAVLIRTSVIAVFGIAAWIVYSSIAPGVHHDPTFTNELVLELFVAIATEGVVMMLIELLPFHLLEGERLYRRSRVLWGASYLVLLVIFLLAVVPWEGNWRELGESFWPWFTAVAIFGVVCVSIYLYFRFLAPHVEEDGDHDASLEDDQERIAVGDD